MAEDGSTFTLVASSLQFNEQPANTNRSPRHGEHPDDVLLELGLDINEIVSLKAKGAIL